MRLPDFRVTAVPAALAMALAACDMPWRVAGGSGTETSNGEIVAGRIYSGEGKPAVGATVYVRPAGYLKDTAGMDSVPVPSPADAVTDKDGRFRLKSLAAGEYKAEVRDGKGGAVQIGFHLLSPDKTLELRPDTLRPVGILLGWAAPMAGAAGPAGPMYVQVYGLDRLAKTDAKGFFVIPDLPAGQIRFRVLSSRPGVSYAAPALAVIAPGATVTVDTLKPVTFENEDYSQWPFTRRCFINTGAAGIKDTVYDFPMLVRLDPDRFDFDLSDGKDLRFSSASGKHLPYQVDSWDPANRQAAVWVKLDTVLPDSREQSVTLHFGRRDAPDFSDGKAVFSGFGGVWHFSEPVEADGEAFFQDASPSGAAGAGDVVPGDRRGAIGQGVAFKGAHQVVAGGMPAMMPVRTVTLSAWAYSVGTGPEGGELASMGDNYGLRTMPDGNGHFFIFTDTSVHDPRWKPANYFPFASTRNLDLRGHWHLVTGRYDGAAIQVFVDGVVQAAVAHDEAIQYAFSREFWMGRHGNGHTPYNFTGSLDEVQISPVARSPAWIRLAYLSQMPGAAVLEFR
jgi:hypothetical protein